MPNMTLYTAVSRQQAQPSCGRSEGHRTNQHTFLGVASAGFAAGTGGSTGVKATFSCPYDCIELIDFGFNMLTDTTAMTTSPQFSLQVIRNTVPTTPVAPVTGQPAVAAAVLVNPDTLVNPSRLTLGPTLQYVTWFNTLDYNYTATPATGQAGAGAPAYPLIYKGDVIILNQDTLGVGAVGTVQPYLVFRTSPIRTATATQPSNL